MPTTVSLQNTAAAANTTHNGANIINAGGDGCHHGMVLPEGPTSTMDMVASLPPARLCKEAWPLLPAEQRLRRAASCPLPSAVHTGGSDPMDMRLGDVDDARLAATIDAAADAYAAVPDNLTTLAPLRAALFESAWQQRFVNTAGRIADCFRTVAPSAPSIGRGRATAATARGMAMTARARRGGRGVGQQRHPATAADASVLDAPPESISILLSCPTFKKDDTRLVAALHRMLTDGHEPAASVDDVMESVEHDFGLLVQLVAGAKGPKLHQFAVSTLQVFATLGMFLGHSNNVCVGSDVTSSAPEVHAARNAGFVAIGLLRLLTTTYRQLAHDVRSLPESWYGRVVAPVFHLIPFFAWRREHFIALTQELRCGGALIPTIDEVAALNAAAQHGDSEVAGASTIAPPLADAPLGGNNRLPDGCERISFDEHVHIDNRPVPPTSPKPTVAARSTAVAPAAPSGGGAATTALPPPSSSSWSAFVAMPYASRISVSVHTATRCETVRICLMTGEGRASAAAAATEGGASGAPSATLLAANGSEDRTTRVIVDVAPRSTHALSDGGSVYVRSVAGGAYCHFQASVVGSITITLDVTWYAELREAYLKAAIFAVEGLLMIQASPTHVLRGHEQPAAVVQTLVPVLCGGRCAMPAAMPAADSGAMHRCISLRILEESDVAFGRRIRCRANDAAKLRSLLALAAHCMPALSCEDSTDPFAGEVWLELSRKALLFTERLATVQAADAERLAAFVVCNTKQPPDTRMSPQHALDVAFQAMSQHKPTAEIAAAILTARSEAAAASLAGLSTLVSVASTMTIEEMHHVAKAFRRWMRGDAGTRHYLSRLAGCGEALEEEVRQAAHRLMSYLFQALAVAIRRIASSSSRRNPFRYVVNDTKDGALMVLTLALLAAPLDTKDVSFMSQSRIADQLLGVLPNFTDFATSNSFYVEEETESGMECLMQSLMDQWQALGVHAATPSSSSQSSRRRGSQSSTTSSLMLQTASNALPQAQRGQNGAWMVNGASRSKWLVSKQPVLHTAAAAMEGTPFLPFVEVAVKTRDPRGGVIIALVKPLAAEQGIPTSTEAQRAMPAPEETAGSFFFAAEGTLTTTDACGATTVRPWITLDEGDVVGLGCVLNGRTQVWELHVWLNGMSVAVLPIVVSCLHLGIGLTERQASPPSRASVEVLFGPSAVHERAWHAACVGALGRGLLPTMHEVALYASHAFHVLMSRCARYVSRMRHQMPKSASTIFNQPPGSQPQSPLSSGGPGGSFRDFALSTLVERGTDLLCNNYESILSVLEQLPTTAATPSGRVKISAAHHVYNTVLQYLLGTVRVVTRLSGFQVTTFEVVCRTVGCSLVDHGTRVAAIQLIGGALEDPRFQQLVAQRLVDPPHALWAACFALGSLTTASSYTPLFCEGSVGPKLMVEEGGRVVASTHAQRHASVKSTAYAVPGISLDASSQCNVPLRSTSNVISYSARMFRHGRSGGSLGRYYFIGLIGYKPNAANSIFTDYTRNVSDKCYVLSDYASETPQHVNKVELERYRRNWMTPSEGNNESAVVFGSGDLITVSVDVRRRTIAFQRNSLPLGTLYQDLPADVVELFPLLCLYNGDATAAMQVRPSEAGIRSRGLMRQLLKTWPETFVPQMLTLIDDREAVALRVLHSDGNDAVFFQRSGGASASGAASGRQTPQRYTFVRYVGDHIEVADADGRHRLVPADSVVQDYASATTPFYDVQAGAPAAATAAAMQWRAKFVEKLIDVVTSSVMDDGNGCVCILTPRCTIRALRLLCQLPFEALHSVDPSHQRDLMDTLRVVSRSGDDKNADDGEVSSRFVQQGGDMVSAAIQAAWTEIDTLDEHQAVFHSNGELMEEVVADYAEDDDVEEDEEAGTHNSDTVSLASTEPLTPATSTMPAVESAAQLHCPQCGVSWGKCSHHAPLTRCELVHLLLTRFHVPSPYAGWRGSWGNDNFQLTLQPKEQTHRDEDGNQEAEGGITGRVDIEGNGEDDRGRFTVKGFAMDRYRITGKLQYVAYSSGGDSPLAPDAEAEATEWTCDACTLINPIAVSRCGVCNSGRPGSCWTCQGCTYAFNSVDVTACMMCGTRRVVEDRGDDGTALKARCIVCRASKNFATFETFQKTQDCSVCQMHTTWVPEETFTATFHGVMTTDGDAIDACIQLSTSSSHLSWQLLKSHTFTFPLLRTILREEGGPEASKAYNESIGPLPTVSLKRIMDAHKRDLKQQRLAQRAGAIPLGLLGGEHELVLRMLGARLGLLGGAAEPTSPTSPTAPPSQLDCSQSSIRCATQMLASRAICSWLPGLVASQLWSIEDACMSLLELRACSEPWLASWDQLSAAASNALVDRALTALLQNRVGAPTASAIATACLYLLKTSTPEQKSLLIAGLAQVSCTWRHHQRELLLRALLQCFEVFGGDALVNVSPILKLLSQQPLLLSQQQLSIFAALHGVESGRRQSAVTAAKWVVQAMHQMLNGRPLSRFFDDFHPDHAPHLVVLPDTRLSDGGDLMVGQVRGSVAVHPNRGGRYYYEMVLPPNFGDRLKVIVMGWGSKLHEVQGSSQHVGSNFHSWGFNGRNRVRLLTGEHEIPIPHNPVAGDVVGSLLDLDTKQMCWSVNGVLLQWVDIPLQGDGEPIYPYVSASVEPHHVTVRLNETQYLPDGYTDFRSNIDDALLKAPSTAAPAQSYEFYKDVTVLVNELNASGLRMEALLDGTTSYVERVRALLPQCPHIIHYLARGSDESALQALTQEDLHRRLVPYTRHLVCLSAMAAVVAKRTDLIKDSPLLWSLYQRGKELLFFSARWALVDVHLSRRLNRNAERRPQLVTIDRMAAERVASAKQALAAPPAFGSTCAATQVLPRELVRELLHHSVTGQMYHALIGKDVYTHLNMFSVQIQDGIAEDAGGVTRTAISMMCDELMWSYADADGVRIEEGSTTSAATTKLEPLLPLFVLSDHSTYFNVVPNMKWLSSLTAEDEATALGMYEWLGKLIGNSVLAGTLVYSLLFPRLVWKFLLREEATIEDFFMDCSDSARGALADDAFLMCDEQFYMLPGVRREPLSYAMHEMDETLGRIGSDLSGEEAAAPVPAEAAVLMPATQHDELEPVDATDTEATEDNAWLGPALPFRVEARRSTARHALLHQYDKVLERMRSGFESVVPTAAIEQLRWDDVRQRVCGSDGATPADILANMDLTAISEELQGYLVEAIHAMSNATRSSLLLFATGQRRLPVPEKIRVACGDDPNELPTAHTCSPISIMLQPYRSATELLKKLSLSLAHVYEFGFV